MKRLLLLAALAPLLTGCLATLGGTQVVKVAVPVPCEAQEPARPAMPTERLRVGVGVEAFVKAAQAELDLREAYELQLRLALQLCIAPVEGGSPP